MIQEASVTGLFRTILLLIGVMVLIRFIGRLMMMKRSMSETAQHQSEEARRRKERESVQKNMGKTRVLSKEERNFQQGHTEDADFTEL